MLTLLLFLCCHCVMVRARLKKKRFSDLSRFYLFEWSRSSPVFVFAASLSRNITAVNVRSGNSPLRVMCIVEVYVDLHQFTQQTLCGLFSLKYSSYIYLRLAGWCPVNTNSANELLTGCQSVSDSPCVRDQLSCKHTDSFYALPALFIILTQLFLLQTKKICAVFLFSSAEAKRQLDTDEV